MPPSHRLGRSRKVSYAGRKGWYRPRYRCQWCHLKGSMMRDLRERSGWLLLKRRSCHRTCAGWIFRHRSRRRIWVSRPLGKHSISLGVFFRLLIFLPYSIMMVTYRWLMSRLWCFLLLYIADRPLQNSSPNNVRNWLIRCGHNKPMTHEENETHKKLNIDYQVSASPFVFKTQKLGAISSYP